MVLGQAAAEADHERPGELEEAAAAEIELGGQALRAMWRWTCHQVLFPGSLVLQLDSLAIGYCSIMLAAMGYRAALKNGMHVLNGFT